MALSDSDKIIIANTVSGMISGIKIGSKEDFLTLIKELKSLRLSNVTTKFDLTSITDYMDPDFGAVLPKDRTEFIRLCESVISNRINYFEGLSDSEKEDYINAQKIHKLQVESNQDKLKKASAPKDGSAAHVDPDPFAPAPSHLPITITTLDSFRAHLSYHSTQVIEQYSHNYTFFAPPPRRAEPTNFGNWTRTSNTWEQGNDPTPREPRTHFNRQLVYKNNNIKMVKKISVVGYADNSSHLFCWCDYNFSTSQLRPFVEALNNNGIDASTSEVISMPCLAQSLRINITANNINDILDKFFNSVNEIEGENSINAAMKEDITRSLQQFISATPGSSPNI